MPSSMNGSERVREVFLFSERGREKIFYLIRARSRKFRNEDRPAFFFGEKKRGVGVGGAEHELSYLGEATKRYLLSNREKNQEAKRALGKKGPYRGTFGGKNDRVPP